MKRRNTFSLLLVVLLSLGLIAPAAGAQATTDFFFGTENGNVVFSNVSASYLTDGYGTYVAVITITPTQQEIDNLLSDGWSHVDIDIHFRGLRSSGGWVDHAPAVSDYVRQVGARVDTAPGYPVYRALGLNIENRWEANKPFTVFAPILGYQPSVEGRPAISVVVVSSKWWFADGQCAVAYERTTNNETLQYCTVQDPASRASLYDDTYRDSRIPLN